MSLLWGWKNILSVRKEIHKIMFRRSGKHRANHTHISVFHSMAQQIFLKGFLSALQRLSAWTSSYNELLDWPLQAVLGHGHPTRGWTCLSKQMNPPGDCLDKSVWPLIGEPCPRTAQTGWSQDSSDPLVQTDN